MKKKDPDLSDVILKALDNATDAVAVMSGEREIYFCNRSWKRLHGIDESLTCMGEVFNADGREVLEEIMMEGRETIKRQKKFSRRFWAPWCEKWLFVDASMIDSTGSPVMTVIIKDVTKTVAEEEDRLRKQITNLPMPVFLWKKRGKEMVLSGYNDASMALTDSKIAEMIGMNSLDVCGENSDIHEAIWKVYETRKMIEIETRYDARFSDKSWWFSIKLIYLDPGTVLVHVEDITERIESRKELESYRDRLEEKVEKRTTQLKEVNRELRFQIAERLRGEEALKQSESRYRAVTELTCDYTWAGVLYPDGSRNREWVAGSFSDIYGYAPDELENEPGFMGIIYPEDREKEREYLSEIFKGKMTSAEFRVVTKDGDVKWILTQGMPLGRTEDGGIRLLSAVKEITKRKKSEIELENRNRELRALDRISRLFKTGDEREKLLIQILEIIREEGDIKHAGVYVPHKEEEGLVCLYASEVSDEMMSQFRHLSKDDPTIRALISADSAFVAEDQITDTNSARNKAKDAVGVGKTIILPIKIGDELVGLYILGIDRHTDIPDEKKDFFNIVCKQIGLEFERAELLDARMMYEKQLKGLAKKLLQSIEEERSQIALDLHDEIGQSIVVLEAEISMCEKKLGTECGEIGGDLRKIRKMLQALMEKIRQSAYTIHPAMLEDLGLVPTLQWYVDKVVEKSGINTEIIASGFDERISTSLAIVLYRVAQEALTNIIRHGHAKNVVIKLIKGYPNVIMDIKDDGRGFRLKGGSISGGGIGIIGMRERTQNANGKFDIQSTPGKGTRVRVSLPLEVENE